MSEFAVGDRVVCLSTYFWDNEIMVGDCLTINSIRFLNELPYLEFIKNPICLYTVKHPETKNDFFLNLSKYYVK